MTSAAAFWRRHWFLVGLGGVAVAAVAAPAGGVALRQAGFVLPAMTAASLFLSGVSLETAGLREGADKRGWLLGVSSTYLVAPALAVAFVRLWGPENGGAGSEGYLFFEAMMIVAAQAGTIASAPALTLVAGGNQGLALLITLSTNLMTAFVTPLLLRITIGTVVSFPVGRMMLEDAAVVLLPVLAAQVVHRLFWPRLHRFRPAIVHLSQAIILVFVYTGISAAAAHLSQRPGLIFAFVATAASLHVALLLWNHRAASWLGLSPANRTAVVFCGSQKTLPNGIYLWDTFFPANPHGALALVCYHVFQLVLDSLLVPWLAPRPVAAQETEEIVDGA
ncbi:MAG: bile acid:sodium symporter [Deltaproteobacteria bacterium]|nr:bile acid:sodium symporter [Deltaproteobacteria bacterium]